MDLKNNLKGVNKIYKYTNFNIINGNENSRDSYILAGNIHKNVRKNIQDFIRPGASIYNLANKIRENIRCYTNKKGVNCGIAFPPILSVNNCIAHYSPTKDNDIILKYDDNVKIDFGVQVNGYIVDSAFSCYFNPKHEEIHNATKEALYEGLKHVGVDAYINDVSKSIEEVINSYDFTIIEGVGGHNIKRYNIHGDIFISNKSNKSNFNRFKEGVYAIEPFVSYKSKYYFNGKDKNNYRVNNNSKLFEYFNNLIFTDADIEYYNINNIFHENKKNMSHYPALYINKDDIGVQYEHTVFIDDNYKNIVTKYIDY